MPAAGRRGRSWGLSAEPVGSGPRPAGSAPRRAGAPAGARPRRRASSSAAATRATSTSAPNAHHRGELPDAAPAGAAVSAAASGTIADCETVWPAALIDTRTVAGSVAGRGNVSTNRLRSVEATWSNGRSEAAPVAATATPPVTPAASDQYCCPGPVVTTASTTPAWASRRPSCSAGSPPASGAPV